MSAIAATAALAVPRADADVPTARVAYRDLDLSTPKGQATLRRRIADAVDGLCGGTEPRDLDLARAGAKCRQVALASVATRMAALARPATQLAANGGGTVHR